MVSIIVPLALFSAVFGAIYVFIMTKHREKMYMMENQLDREEYGFRLFDGTYQTLKVGILMISLAVGLLAGNYLDETYWVDKEFAHLFGMLLFGGIGLIIHFLIEKNSKPNGRI